MKGIGRKINFLGWFIVFAVGPTFAQTPELKINSGHSASVLSVAYSPDNRYIASASEDKTIKIWDVQSRRELKTLYDDAEVRSVRFLNDGTTLVSAGWGGLKLWNVISGKSKDLFSDYKHFVTPSKNSSLLLFDDGYSVVLYDLKTNSPVREFKGHEDFVLRAVFSPDGKYIASCGYDKTVRLWDLATGNLLRTLVGHGDTVSAVVFSPDGKFIISGGGADDPTIRFWNIITGKQTVLLQDHQNAVEDLTFTPAGDRLVSSSADGTIKFWDPKTGVLLGSLETKRGATVTSIAFSADGRQFASAYDDKTIGLWDVTSGTEIASLPGDTVEVKRLAFSPDGKTILTSSTDQTLRAWNLYASANLRVLLGGRPQEMAEESSDILDFSQDGKRVLVSLDSGFAIWDTEKGLPLVSFDAGYTDLGVFSPDGLYIATTNWDEETGQTIGLWDASTGELIKTFNSGGDSLSKLAFSADGQYLCAGTQGETSTIRVWNIISGKELPPLVGHENAIEDFHSSADGKTLISASADGTIRFWDISTGDLLKTLGDADGSMISSIALSADGKYLVSGHFYQEFAIKLWNVATGKVIKIYDGHQGGVTAVDFSPNGDYIVSAGSDGSVKLWDVKGGNCVVTRYDLPHSTDWVAVTADGRFDGTAGGMNLLYYVSGMDIIPLESFYERFFSPSLVSQVLRGDTGNRTYQSALNRVLKLPPKVRILNPQDGQTLRTDRLEVTVEAEDQGGGIDEIRLYQNGKLVETTQRGLRVVQTGTSKRTQTFLVPLVPGSNVFKATAFNVDRTESSPAAVTVTVAGSERNTTLYLLVVGINTYKNPDYTLNYAYPDAKAIRDKLTETGRNIYREIKTYELYNEGATKAAMVSAFSKIRDSATANDVFLFFYAGHGIMTEPEGQNPAKYYLIPSDVVKMYGTPAALDQGALSADELRDWCRDIKAQKQVILLDACQSGGAVATFAMRGSTEEKAIMQLGRSAGVVVLASTGTQQNASEFSQLKHGIFTYALLEGLSGKADGGTRDKKITIKELESFVNDYIPELSQRYRGEIQYPNSYATGMDFPLGVVP